MKALPTLLNLLLLSAGCSSTPQLATPPTTGASAQPLSATDYSRAARFLSTSADSFVFHAGIAPIWLDDHRAWYRNRIPGGFEYVVVDAEKRTRERAFDHDRLARALGTAADTLFRPLDLPRAEIEGDSVTFVLRNRRYVCHVGEDACAQRPLERRSRNEIRSPDGTRDAFTRDHNLWMRNVATGVETHLTSDGIEHYGYATNNAGWTRSDRPVLLWSPDSRKIATFRHDGRGVREMYLTTTNVGHPRLEAWKYPLPGDSLIFRIERVVIHVDEPRVVRLNMPPDPHRSTVCDHVVCRGDDWTDVQWSDDGTQLAFVSSSRDHKDARLRVANPETGSVRDVLEETAETFFESGFRSANWRVLFDRNEVLWYSQRDDWGHLYIYDLESGDLKRRLTHGDWNVLQVRQLDDEGILFTGAGREPGDPYFQYLYRVPLGGGDAQLLTPEPGDHSATLSPDGRYFVDSYSTPETPPVTVVRTTGGDQLLELERADITRLVERGWQPPHPFRVVARDGRTDLYGLMYVPTRFDASRSYPIINYVYPGPQTGSVGSRSFSAARGDKQALAELGFVVVELDAMGTPMRSKSFHAAYYGNMGDNGLPDQITAIRQLAARFPWMDLDRVGIYGHSGGGYASTAAVLRHPDFYKVAVSGAGNHDNRNYEDDWGEKWQGLLERYPDGTSTYDNQANQLVARNLKGKLLLGHGTMDANVPYYSTLLVVDSLIAANKDFDLVLLPNRGHGFGREDYWMRRRWDYFVRHLLGIEPPKEFSFSP